MTKILFTILVVIGLSSAQIPGEALKEITFFGFKDSFENRFISTFNTSIAKQGCDMNGMFAMVVHGWLEGIDTPWVEKTVNELLKHRGGCVFFMDYSVHSKTWNYFNLLSKFEMISEVLFRKFQQIGNYERQFCYGFSFGSRLCIDVGINLGEQKIDRMDLCDLTGPGFKPFLLPFRNNPRDRDPKLAAKNVQCIYTSVDKGTNIYSCHQNFRMGYCGQYQHGAGPFPMGSHGLCPYFYNEAFDTVFVSNNHYNCTSPNMVETTADTRMGYLGNFKDANVRGDIFIATAKYPPFLVVDNVLDNAEPATIRFPYNLRSPTDKKYCSA